MISFLLVCMLWSKPELKAVEIPLDEFAMATLDVQFKEFRFEATVMEERMSSIKITHPLKNVSTESYSSSGYQLRTLATHLTIGEEEASLDCEVRKIVPQEEK